MKKRLLEKSWQVCRQTLDPVWDEALRMFWMQRSDSNAWQEHQFRYNPGGSLQFQVLDKDGRLPAASRICFQPPLTFRMTR